MTINIKGYDVLIDDALAPMILARKWHIADRKRGIYFATSIRFPDGKYRSVKLHRFILECPPGLLVDHKNTNCLDCRRQNLRVCTTAENTRNSGVIKSTTGYRGVNFHKGTNKYRAHIKYNNEYIYLGLFNTAEEAAAEYERNAKILFGEFYRAQP